MAIAVTFDLSVIPDRLDDFLAMLKDAAPDTRAYDGCISFDIWLDQDTPGRVLFYELWESKAQQETYLAWRAETGMSEAMGPFMAGAMTVSYHDKFDG